MKFLIKYLFAMYGSMFLFINNNNELSFVDVISSSLSSDSETVRTKTKTIDKKTNNDISKLLTLKVLPNKADGETDFVDIGLPIQLMDESYKVLMTATTENGVVRFDLNQLNNIPEKLILLSPVTANEITVTPTTGYAELMIDADEQLPLQITAKYLEEKK